MTILRNKLSPVCLLLLSAVRGGSSNGQCSAGDTAENCSKDGPPSAIPVVIVDEHHHVVDHWFSLADESNRLNATLVHIDAHADYGPPLSEDLIAPWPKDLNKLREHLENDQFIVMAIRWGLIRRVINIYPSFSKRYVDAMHPERRQVYHLGPHVDGETWCECLQPAGRRKKVRCEAEEDNVPATACSHEVTVDVISLSIDRAQEYGIARLIDSSQPLILDIDEDYFAVESPFVQVMKTGHREGSASSVRRELVATADWRKGNIMTDLQDWLRGIFCAQPPRVAQREQAVDVFLRGVASVVLAVKEVEAKAEDFTKQLSRKFAEQTGLLHDVIDALCQPSGNADADKQTVLNATAHFAWSLMDKFPVEGIYKLLEYGVCIDCDEVPRDNYYLWMCLGSSRKGDATNNRLEYHNPTVEDVNSDMARLHSVILSELSVSPAMITVCRSMRDAYIPRHLWPGIEEGVLNIANDVGTKLGKNLSITYDRDCHWGAQGYPSRSAVPISAFLEEHGVPTSSFYTSTVVKDELA